MNTRKHTHTTQRFSGWALGLAVAATVGLMATAASASITIDNSQTSGTFDSTETSPGSYAKTISYANNSDFLVVMTGASSNNRKGYVTQADPNAAPTVTYGGATLTQGMFTYSDTASGFIHYIANPAQGANDLVVDFGGDFEDDGDATPGSIQFGALSLGNVDLSNPIAATHGPTGLSDSTNYAVSGSEISAGDFFAVVTGKIHVSGLPNFETGSTDGSTAGEGDARDMVGFLEVGRESQAHYQQLIATDLAGAGGELTYDAFADRSASEVGGIVFNAIPEPASLALLGFGGLMLMPRRRRH